ncbi:MAG: aldo/keto reductase [Acidisphaera sp.]|nr:aldo/keto reductase [Acidisphaera sp.]
MGGLMVRGAHADQERAVGRALDAGVNYFDTAAQYGDGTSETNLGRILARLRPNDAVVGTKVRVSPEAVSDVGAEIRNALDASLRRLQREQVDIFHLHNPITETGGGESLSARRVMHDVVPALQALRDAGKTRLIGLTAVGETPAVREVIDSGVFGSAQVVFNMLNPSAAMPAPHGYPAQDYQRLFEHTRRARAGVVAIRVLAGGALSGVTERHPIASPPPSPIGSAADYGTDLTRARRLLPLVSDGFAGSLAEAAVRFAVARAEIGTMLVGMATVEQFEAALAAVQKGPLPPEALQRIAEIAAGFAKENG